jgi:hypothetical protein
VTLIGVTAIDCSNRTSALLKDLRPGEYQFLGIINPYINFLKSFIVYNFRKINSITSYVPRLDLNVNIG